MKQWDKLNLVISKCLGDSPCRYDGQKSPCSIVKELKPFANIIEVCPEQEIGLPTPRESIRLLAENNSIKLIEPISKKDLTPLMSEFAEEFFTSLDLKNITGFILKSRSPSCGLKDVKIYNSTVKGASFEKGKGVFAEALYKKFPNAIIEEDGRIKNFSIREHFLTRLFTLSSFKKAKNENKFSSLLKFHTLNKLLFKSYNQVIQKTLGGLVANHEDLPLSKVFKLYEENLLRLMIKAPSYKRNINVLNHSLGYFEELPTKEKDFFYEILNKYRNGKVPLSVPKILLKSYAIRFSNNYLLSQTFLEPYPEELMNLSDSGKGVVR